MQAYRLLRGRGPSSLKAGPRVHIHVVMQVGAPEVEVLTTDIFFSLFISFSFSKHLLGGHVVYLEDLGCLSLCLNK